MSLTLIQFETNWKIFNFLGLIMGRGMILSRPLEIISQLIDEVAQFFYAILLTFFQTFIYTKNNKNDKILIDENIYFIIVFWIKVIS